MLYFIICVVTKIYEDFNIFRFTHVVVDVVTTRQSGSVHVVFVADAKGLVRKLSVVPNTRHICLLEVLAPFSSNSSVTIHTLRFLKDTVSATPTLNPVIAYVLGNCRFHYSISYIVKLIIFCVKLEGTSWHLVEYNKPLLILFSVRIHT